MKLKPCPWGHKARLRSDGTVLCEQEGCELQHTYMTVDVWNTRPGEKAARVEALEALKKIAGYAELLEIMYLPNRDKDPNHPTSVIDAIATIKLIEADG